MTTQQAAGHGGMAGAWDRASAVYLARRGDDASTVSYGNLAPTEADVHLLGDLPGRRVLDMGCGGGHNSVACALAGAQVVGVDVSAVQLAAARALAVAYGVNVTWQQGDVTTLADRNTLPFDLILAIQVLPYVEHVPTVLARARQLLRTGGQLVVSIDHPLRNCFYDEDMGELSPFPVRDYAVAAWLQWDFAPGVPMRMQHQPLSTWLRWVVAAGFAVEQLIEAAAPPEICDDLWPEDSPLAPLRQIPHTAILVARAV